MNINTEPLVSIVIPCYNHENFVQECIQSVIDQDYKNIELIIIDDGSPDDSVRKIEEMIPKCKERFVRFEFRHRSNKGLCATLNEALTWCEGLYYSAFASDDVMLPQKTSTQVKYFSENTFNPNIIGVFGAITFIGDKISYKKTKGENAIYQFKDIFLHECIMTTPTLMLVREKILEIGGYDEDILIEDLDLFLKLSSQGYSFKSIDTPLVLYRRHQKNLSGKHDLMFTSVKKILCKYEHHPLFTKALSNGYMVSAHSIQANDKKSSWNYIIDAIKIYPMNIFSKSFLKFLMKAIYK